MNVIKHSDGMHTIHISVFDRSHNHDYHLILFFKISLALLA
jgi:hypothetical protein